MTDFKTICEKALSYSGQPCINSIVKIKRGFLFRFCDNEGNDLYINPVFVSDNGRKTNVYFPPDHDDEVLYHIVIPEEYRLKE